MSRSASPAWRGATVGRPASSAPRAAGAHLRCRGGLGRLARRILGVLLRGFLGRTDGFLFRRLARLFLAPAGLLGGRQDGDLFLFAPFRLALRVLSLLLDQCPLPRGLFRRGQRARRGSDAPAAPPAPRRRARLAP